MAFTLHAAIVPTQLQVIDAILGILDKAEAHCSENGLLPEELIQARLAEDMFTFAYQVKSVAVHSLGAFEGVRNGLFAPDVDDPPGDFAGLRAKVSEARAGLAALDPAEVESCIGKPMRFAFREFEMHFNAEDFLLSFSQPNFFFHAATAYDILRWKGVPLGKRDFMGPVRVKA